MVIAGRFEVKVFIFLALASLSWVCVVASRGNVLRDRRGLTDVVPEDFTVLTNFSNVNSADAVPTDFNVNANEDDDDNEDDNDDKKKKKKKKKSKSGGKKKKDGDKKKKDGDKKKKGGGDSGGDDKKKKGGGDDKKKKGAGAPVPFKGPTPPVKTFSVDSYGAKGDGRTNNAESFMQAWVAACKFGGPAKLLFPKATYMSGPVVFQGPCGGHTTVVVLGTIKATSDISDYTESQWFSFEKINGLSLFGGGTFDGQGAEVWEYNDCKKNKDCQLLPASIKIIGTSNVFFHDINSINSKSFHVHITDCQNVKAYNLNITAPDKSPNTDGLHISTTTNMNLTHSHIGTGDDCVSVGHGVNSLAVSNISCGPGHGISIGSLGKYENEEDVNGVFVTDCTLTKTTNGVRIKTYPGSSPSKASNITFQNIIMNDVDNPIIIDQTYGTKKKGGEPSQVAISNVHYRNIRGTSITDVALSLECSSSFPCAGLELANINLKYTGGKTTAMCQNAKIATTSGTQIPACPNSST